MRRFAILLLLLVGCSRQPATDDANRAPDFELAVLYGEQWKLSDALDAGPVLLDFWATWCAPCKISMPHYQTLADKYADRGLQVISISEDNPRSHHKIVPFFDKAGLSFPVLLDSDRAVGQLYQVNVLPTSFLIDSSGHIVARHVGYQEGQAKELEAQILSVLGNSAPSR